MSETPLMIVSGVMPCVSLYLSWMSRRRCVSRTAPLIDSVSLSPYMITRPFTLRAARPIV